MAQVSKPYCRATIAGKSHAGLVRSNNEDNIVFDPQLNLMILADGMGGHNAGEIASAIAVRTVYRHVHTALGKPDLVATESGYSAEAEILRAAIRAAHAAIKQAAHQQPAYTGMGTTIVVALLCEDRLVVAHVGDSRLYRLRDNMLEQLTRDHSLIEELVARGFYTPEEARIHVKKNLITRALGNQDETLEVDLLDEPLVQGDLLLLCSDGLTDMAGDVDIGAALRKVPMPASPENLQTSVDELIELALMGGGKDNVSVITAQVSEVVQPAKRWFSRLFDWFQ